MKSDDKRERSSENSASGTEQRVFHIGKMHNRTTRHQTTEISQNRDSGTTVKSK